MLTAPASGSAQVWSVMIPLKSNPKSEKSRSALSVVSPPQVYVAPIGHPQLATFFSERMDPGGVVFNPVYRNDYSTWQLKEGE